MTEIEIKKFGKIKTIILDNIIWFVGKDVAKCLKFLRPQQAIDIIVRLADKRDYKNSTLISLNGLCSLLEHTKIKNTRAFEDKILEFVEGIDL